MSGNRDEEPIGIAGINGHLRNLLAIAKSEVGPGLAAIGGLVDAIADGEVRAMQPFAAADVNDLRVGRRDNDGADRAGRLLIENRLPGAAVVRRLPDAAVDRADVEDVRLAGNSCQGASASAAKGANIAPTHFGERFGIDLLGLGVNNYGEGKQQDREKCQFYAHEHPEMEICASRCSLFVVRYGEV